MIDKYSERGIILELETEMNKKSVLESMDQRGKRKNPLVYFRNRNGKKKPRFGIWNLRLSFLGMAVTGT